MSKPNSTTIATMRHLGYRYFPTRATRPPCNGCGPFCSPFLRNDHNDPHGGMVCSGCDEED